MHIAIFTYSCNIIFFFFARYHHHSFRRHHRASEFFAINKFYPRWIDRIACGTAISATDAQEAHSTSRTDGGTIGALLSWWSTYYPSGHHRGRRPFASSAFPRRCATSTLNDYVELAGRTRRRLTWPSARATAIHIRNSAKSHHCRFGFPGTASETEQQSSPRVRPSFSSRYSLRARRRIEKGRECGNERASDAR